MTIPSPPIRPLVGIGAAASLIMTLVAQTPAATADTRSTSSACDSMTAVVHKVTNPKSGATLLTTSKHEADKAKKKYGFTGARSKPFAVATSDHKALVPVHRLYKKGSNDFLWTKSTSEIRTAQRKHGYVDQGVDFYASVSGGNCLKPVHRYVKDGVRRYAVTKSQRQSLAKRGYDYESIAFYAAKKVADNGDDTTDDDSNSDDTTKSKSRPESGPFAWPAYRSKSTAAWHAYANEGNQSTKKLLYQIASTSTSYWLGGRSDDRERVDKIMDDAAKAKRTPQFVLYAVPHRDCGSYSAGGLETVAQYKDWIDSVRKGIDGRKAVIIVEPDAIGMGCLSGKQQADRQEMLRYAMSSLMSKNTWTYLHAGSNGLDPDGVAEMLKKSGISEARGFAVNVSGFDTTSSEIKYGNSILKALDMKKHFVVDTSRGGLGRYSGSNGGAPGWCNPPGRALGERPTIKTADADVDAYLWIKRPGESDGDCHAGDPTAGGWFESYAIGLTKRAIDEDIIKVRPLP